MVHHATSFHPVSGVPPLQDLWSMADCDRTGLQGVVRIEPANLNQPSSHSAPKVGACLSKERARRPMLSEVARPQTVSDLDPELLSLLHVASGVYEPSAEVKRILTAAMT